MSETHRSSAHDAGLSSDRDGDRDAKIEQLLLVGLDHYFASSYELAINVWTRALFFDRNHPRARAYIERARSALAERQRESEELLQTGVAAFQRGDGGEARRLLQAAIDGGAPAEEALAILDRLDRLDTVVLPITTARTGRPVRPRKVFEKGRSRRSIAVMAIAAGLAAVLGAAGLAASLWELPDGPAVFPSIASFVRTAGSVALAPGRAATPPVTLETSLAMPVRGEITLARARTLAAGGHLHDAIATLESIRATDAQKPEADRLRGDLQRQLLAVTPMPSPPSTDRERGDRRVP
jgi:hypothetical protein